MFPNHDNFGHNIFSRKDFLKLVGAGSLFVGLGALSTFSYAIVAFKL